MWLSHEHVINVHAPGPVTTQDKEKTEETERQGGRVRKLKQLIGVAKEKNKLREI